MSQIKIGFLWCRKIHSNTIGNYSTDSEHLKNPSLDRDLQKLRHSLPFTHQTISWLEPSNSKPVESLLYTGQNAQLWKGSISKTEFVTLFSVDYCEHLPGFNVRVTQEIHGYHGGTKAHKVLHTPVWKGRAREGSNE